MPVRRSVPSQNSPGLTIRADLIQTVMKRKLGLFRHNMQNGGQQKNQKCDVGNDGWEGKTWKT